MNGRGASHAVDGTTRCAHGKPALASLRQVPVVGNCWARRPPVEARGLKRAGPLAAIDHLSSPRAPFGPPHHDSLEKPTGPLPTAVVGTCTRSSAQAPKPMGPQARVFAPPTPLPHPKKSLYLRLERRGSFSMRRARLPLPRA
jgi:hypothetical protein